MKTALVLLASLFVVSSASAEDAWTRLRNASANELCWDTARGIAREKYPSAGEATLTEVSLKRPAAPSPVKEGRKAFPGIRTC
jgi:hypothetical protein